MGKLPRTYKDFLSHLQQTSSNEDRMKHVFQGLANNVFVRGVEAIDEMNLQAIAAREPKLYTCIESARMREALVLTAFFRYSLEKGLPDAKEIELEDLPSCSKKDFIKFCSLFTPENGKLKDVEIGGVDEWYVGEDAVKTFLRGIGILADTLLPRIKEQDEKTPPVIPFMNVTPKDIGTLKTVLGFASYYLHKNGEQISTLLNISLQ